MTNPTLKQALVEAFAANPESLVTPEEEADIALQVLSEWEPTKAVIDAHCRAVGTEASGLYPKRMTLGQIAMAELKAALSAACKEDV